VKVDLVRKVGFGGFGDVWEAIDYLGRKVAAKIIRPESVGMSDAMSHAKALARVNHPNLVTIHTFEKVTLPDEESDVDCIVMEFLDGDLLSDVLTNHAIQISEVLRIGSGLISGIEHIHEKGMAHGDFHERNVMVSSSHVKIIDILYRDSLALLVTEEKETRIKRDIMSLRLMLQTLISRSTLGTGAASDFNGELDIDSGIEKIRQAFDAICSQVPGNSGVIEDHYLKIRDEYFVDELGYAEALVEDINDGIIVALICKVIDEYVYDDKRKHLFILLWNRMSESQRHDVCNYLSAHLVKELPKGKFWYGLKMLSTFGSDGWMKMPKTFRIKLEYFIRNDILTGYYDIHNPQNTHGGTLATYSKSFFRYFENQTAFANHMISMLNQNWYTQNYIGDRLILLIPFAAERTNKRSEFIMALKEAVRKDAKRVVARIKELPDDWINEIYG
jgi:hypothetical protein